MLLKIGIIAVLGSLVGFAVVHGIMLVRILKSKPPARIAIWESLAELLMSARAKDYMRLLSETNSKPTLFDHTIYIAERFMGWCLAMGIVMLAVGLIRTE
jgi:hypothetical protein